MGRILLLLGLCGVLSVAVSCAGFVAPVVPPSGTLFSNYKAPLSTEFTGQAVAQKHGEASSLCVLWLFAFGDCSLDAAAKGGNLTSISYCDYAYLNVLGFYQQFTVIAYGK